MTFCVIKRFLTELRSESFFVINDLSLRTNINSIFLNILLSELSNYNSNIPMSGIYRFCFIFPTTYRRVKMFLGDGIDLKSSKIYL